ncbi:MYND finger domain containing protein [Chaetoceros tenuissimus]|uniref:MYND finger domain containing protein n=1 Tax=Chaetoceros tenuissimus TaxID=426638 RepID=A0AAD3CF71_9STRA|nr:MYND finger domain containing protein [Chaetoceros tenuissimus]
MSSNDTPSLFIGKDVYLQNLKSVEYNDLGARCIKYLPAKERYVVRLHLSGRSFVVQEHNMVVGVEKVDTKKVGDRILQRMHYINPNVKGDRKSKNKFTHVPADEMADAIMGEIRKNLEYRKVLSERMWKGMSESNEKGAIVIDLVDNQKIKPTFIDNAHDILMRGDQAYFMSHSELKKKFGKMYKQGRGIFNKTGAFRPGQEFPEVISTSALFAHLLSVKEWDDSMLDTSIFALSKQTQIDHYKTFGIPYSVASEIQHKHFERRLKEGQFDLPLDVPEDELEHYVMTLFHGKNNYYKETLNFWKRDPLSKGRIDTDILHNVFKLKAPKHWTDPLWKNHSEMDGYCRAYSFVVFCFLPISYVEEQHRIQLHMAQEEALDTVDGWRCIGFDAIGFYNIAMEYRMKEAELNMSDLEKMLLFDDRAADDDEVNDDYHIHTQLKYKDNFKKSLPGCHKEKEIKCFNPKCSKSEIKMKSMTGETLERSEKKLMKCSRCLKAYYCSKECSKSDWKRHKKECNK